MLTLRGTTVGERGAIRLAIGTETPGELTRLRALLVGDLLRRVGDVTGVRVLVAADDRVTGREALGIAPAHADPGTFADRADVTIGPGPSGAVRLDVGALTVGGSPGVPPLATPSGDPGIDPAALRLAMLGVPYDQAADLSPDALDTAAADLDRWRGRVAAWAESPSRPMCADHVARLRTAFASDLDTPAALDALAQVAEDPDPPPGSKFETFVFADRVLALELPRDVGGR